MLSCPMNMLPTMTPLTMKNSGPTLIESMLILFRNPWNSPANGEAAYPIPSLKHLKSRNPPLNIPGSEPVVTDTVFSDTPAVDSGDKQAQVFVGRDTLVADAHPMESGKQFVNTLVDNTRKRGAMNKLLSDSAKAEISNKVMDILNITFQIGILSPTTRTRILLNGGTGLSDSGPIQ